MKRALRRRSKRRLKRRPARALRRRAMRALKRKARASKRSKARKSKRRAKYVLKHRGGTRRVLARRDPATQRWIAIKENRKVEEAREEFRAMRSCRDFTHLVRPERFFLRKGKGCIAMEWVPGPTLREAIHRGPFAPAQASAIALGVLGGLKELHRAGFVHGDLHAGNVIVTDLEQGTVKIIDFQHAVPLGPRGRAKAKRKLSKPPPALAPESKRSGIDVRYDLYGVGYMLAAMLLGREPKGKAWRAPLVRALAKNSLPRALPRGRAKLRGGQSVLGTSPREAALGLWKVALKGAHPDRRKRYPSADAMAEAVAAAVSPGAAPLGGQGAAGLDAAT